MDSRRPAFSRLRSSGEELGSLVLDDGDSSGEPRTALASLLKSPWRLNLWSTAIDFGSNRKHCKKLVTSNCVTVEVLLDMLGRDDRIGFSMLLLLLSRKLDDLSSEADV